MATKLSIAANITAIRMNGADSSSSRYFEHICCALRRLIHANKSTRNNKTPEFQQTSTRLSNDQASGRKRNKSKAAAADTHKRK